MKQSTHFVRARRSRATFVSLLCLFVGDSTRLGHADDKSTDAPTCGYEAMVLEDEPVAYWRFNAADLADAIKNSRGTEFAGKAEGKITAAVDGPTPGKYPLFEEKNLAINVPAGKSFVRITDPGDQSELDFDLGDAITLEAWVRPSSLTNDQQVYIIGKGRTKNAEVAGENQNYALRLSGKAGTSCISFLFRNSDNRDNTPEDFHRWTSDEGFTNDDHWHHVAVAYEFGDGASIRGYVDGRSVPGTWDLGGATDKAPVVDNDELWIGSSMGGNPGSTFIGQLDEVAIYRTALAADRLMRRYEAHLPDPREAELADQRVPTDSVLVEIIEGIAAENSWLLGAGNTTAEYSQDSFGFVGTPKKYVDGLIHDRTNPFLVRARTKQSLPAGDYEFLLRAKGAARLYVDGRILLQTNFLNRNADGHEPVSHPKSHREEHCDLLPGQEEKVARLMLDDQPHVFRLEMIVGGKELRTEIGEACVGIAPDGASFTLLAATAEAGVSLNEESWLPRVRRLTNELMARDNANRTASRATVDKYWEKRHAVAREEVSRLPGVDVPQPKNQKSIFNDVDRFIGFDLENAGIEPLPLADDYAFLRRVTLDTIGLIPTREQIDALVNHQSPVRRSREIDRLLDDPRWADRWVSYWQDVLAENPGILKPQLNNTGPFRWWIYESLLDNKPMDQFATELIMMQGSMYGGGPAGFSMATQNDVPMAAKAQVVSKAFLGLEMTCARCHDAPFHSFAQRDLFQLASMLDKKSIKLPATSTVPVAEGARQPAVTITLKPGDEISPIWPLEKIASAEIPAGLLRSPDDSREQLAAFVTNPRNDRFAKVIVNRLWREWMGRGLIDPVDDWEQGGESHPQLLEYLGRELVAHDYNLKHVASLILNSHAYQRQSQTSTDGRDDLWAGQIRRRMSAEQVVDSMFAAAGKELKSEMLTLDSEGRRPVDTFLNLGTPNRAWQFTSLSNERDRPALALPMAQSIIDVLLAYGWRDSRPNSTAKREDIATMLQPLIMANGVAGNRIATLSDDNALTDVCLDDVSVEAVADQLFLRILSRPPVQVERDAIVQLLADGFSTRRVPGAEIAKTTRPINPVSWSNHLSAEATTIMLEFERLARVGDPPTKRLQADWRQRAEDVVWALVNSPEFIFVP